MSYDNSNSGVLFRNVKKQPGDKLPDYRGTAEVNGVALEISAWINTSKKDGKKFMSLKFKPPFRKPEESGRREFTPPPPKSTEIEDDDQKVPF